MKLASAFVFAFMCSVSAHARSACVVSASNPATKNVYDQPLARIHVAADGHRDEGTLLAISSSSQIARVITFDDLITRDDVRRFEGQTILAIGSDQLGLLTVAALKVDMSRKDEALVPLALVSGPVAENQPLQLVLGGSRLAVVCHKE